MRPLAVLAALLPLAIAAPAPADPAGPPTVTAEDLAWLAGCWASVGGEPGSGEQWTAPAGGTMLGVNRTVRDGRTVAWEFLHIRPLDDGRLAYVALPSGQRETAFTVRSATATSVVFENPEHDFPQRVIYALEPDGSLRARIEGTREDEPRGFDFPMRRADCPLAAE